MSGGRRAPVPLRNEPFGIAFEWKMKRAPKVDGGHMHRSDMTQQLFSHRLPVSRALIHNLLEMMRGPCHGQIG